MTVLRIELRASHTLGKPLSCGAIFSGYQTVTVEEHGIYFHNANIMFKLRTSQMDLQLKNYILYSERIYTHYIKPYSSCETQGDLSESEISLYRETVF